MIRAFKRDQLRKQVGNRDLKEFWASFQKKRYDKDYLKVCSRKRGR